LTIISGSIYISLQLTGWDWMIGDGLLDLLNNGYLTNYTSAV